MVKFIRAIYRIFANGRFWFGGQNIYMSAFLGGYRSKVFVGNGVYIGRANLSCKTGGKIIIGDNCHIDDGVIIKTFGGVISFGENVSLNPYIFINGGGGVFIGNNVRIAAHTSIFSANHVFSDNSVPIYKQGETKQGIFIEDDVWIGSGVRILDGVRIGRGVVVGAGSVVNKNLDPYTVNVGVPCRTIRTRK